MIRIKNIQGDKNELPNIPFVLKDLESTYMVIKLNNTYRLINLGEGDFVKTGEMYSDTYDSIEALLEYKCDMDIYDMEVDLKPFR